MSGTRAGAIKGWQTRRRNNPPESPEIIQAYRDWLTNRAYLDNGGNYRVKSVDTEGYFLGGSRPAPWNRAVKHRFGKDQSRGGNERFHDAAHRYADKHHWQITKPKHYGTNRRSSQMNETMRAYFKTKGY